MSEPVEQLFRDAMASLASGIAVVTARREDGSPCGLAATSLASFSVDLPSVLVSIARSSRCHDALVRAEHFGVHILSAEQEPLARVFAGRGVDKFAGVEWSWDDDVPAIEGAMAYLRCRRVAVFEHYDHSILVGDVLGGVFREGEPLVYLGRSMGWRLRDA
jgi:flavin reductase ActVB